MRSRKPRRERKKLGYMAALEDYRVALAGLAAPGLTIERAEYADRVEPVADGQSELGRLNPGPFSTPSRLAAALREARLFVVDPALFRAWYEAADRYTTEVVAGLRFRGRDDPPPPPSEIDVHLSRISEAGRLVPLADPGRWPFRAMWVAYVDKRGGRIMLTRNQLIARLGEPTVETHGLFAGVLLAHAFLVYDGAPLVLEVVHGHACDPDMLARAPAVALASALTDGLVPGTRTFFMWDAPFADGAWTVPYGLAPWTTLALFSYLAQFRAFVIEQPWPRRAADGPSLPGEPADRPPPEPYYLLRLRQHEAVEQAPHRIRPPHTWRLQHRCDVMGHERVRLRRGHGKIDARTRQRMLARGYRVYDGRPVKPYDVTRLTERNVRPPGPNEWLAMKVTWIVEHQRGPEGAPYVPALRVA